MKLILVLSLLTLSAFAAPEKGDIVLFDSMATGGQMFQMAYATKRVGLVVTTNEEKSTVQEIDYPSRMGMKVFRKNAQGEDVLSEGMNDEMTSTLLSKVDSITTADGKMYEHGSSEKLHVRFSRIPGRVLYLFQQGDFGYLALTDETGWAKYQKHGDSVFEKDVIRLQVKKINLVEKEAAVVE